MKSQDARVSRLEKEQPAAPIVFDVYIVEITDAMREEQKQAQARGERYYIVEPNEATNE